jgi:hypothetical protein
MEDRLQDGRVVARVSRTVGRISRARAPVSQRAKAQGVIRRCTRSGGLRLRLHPVRLSWSGSLIRPTNCVHELVNLSLSPSPRPRLSCWRPVQRGGASRGVTEVGQSESWPEGQPDGRCGARGHASQAWTRGALGNRPCPLRGAAFSGWTRQVKGGETYLDGELARACARKSGPKDEEVAAAERREALPCASVSRRSGK